MMGHSLLHTSDALPPLLAGFAAYFVNTFVTYWWHRAPRQRHALAAVPPVAPRAATHRGIHLLLQASDRDGLQLAAGQLVAYVVMGISIEAGAYYIMFAALGEMFYHSNLRTPHVLGYLFQRPEMHRIHHQRDRHECNYSDFPRSGTCCSAPTRTPRRIDEPQGFAGDKEQQFVDMLLFRDVHSLPGKTQPAPVLVKPDVR